MKKQFTAAAWILILLLCGGTARADIAHDAASHSAGYSAVLYDSTNGLPTSDVNALVQTEEGFLWIGSYSGLIRYDGNEFYRYDSSNGVSSVVSLFADSRQRLWIGTNDSGVGMLEHESFTFYTREDGLRSSSVRSLTEDGDGNILIATTMGVAYVDPEGTLHSLDAPQINSEYIRRLEAGGDGLVYGVTNAGAFFIIDHLRLTAFYSSESLGLSIVNTIYPDPEHPGWVYLGTQESTVIYGNIAGGMAERYTYSVAPLDYVNAIRELNGLLWVCSDTGIGFLDENRNYVPIEDLPMTNSIEQIMADFEDNLWFTSSRQGLMKIVPNRFSDIFKAAELPSMVINSTCRYDGLLYIGGDKGLIILDASNQVVENALTEALAGIRIRCVRADSRGRLWLCTNSEKGLLCYVPATGELTGYTTDSGLASNRPRMVLELSDGTLAIATNAGVNLLRDGAITDTYDQRQGISNTTILCIEEGADGQLYFGSDGGGIFVLNGSSITHLGLDDGLSSEVILRLKRDETDENLIWIITSNAICYLRDGRITSLRSFPYSNNFDLHFDDDGRVWVLSSNGIYVLRRDDMLADRCQEYTLYDMKCGLPCASTANSYSHLDEDGTLYISATKGVSSINIFNDADDNSDVRLAVPYVVADDVYLYPSETGEIRVPSDCKRLTIYPYALTFTLRNPHVLYYLEGFDDAPVEDTKQNLSHISYTNLAGGEYTFRLSVLNTLTGEQDQSIAVRLVKEKSLQEQPWYHALVLIAGALLAALAVMLFYREKTRRLMRKQAENKQLINEMTSVFASCIDMKDAYTNGHSHRVAKYTAMLAEHLGKSKEEIENIYNIALLHDIGKISIPDKVLNKPEKLTDEEFAIMKTHSERGYEILKEITIAPDLALGAGYHHERLDGKGYPRGLKGDEIPEIAQIIAVADMFDAMYSTRPYRKKLPLETVAAELRKVSGTQLNPKVVDAFLELVREGKLDDE